MELNQYLSSQRRHRLPLQDRLLAEEGTRNDICPSVGFELGSLLYILIRALGARRVLEVGTSVGYGAIWMGLALKETGGVLDTIEEKPHLAAEAVENVREAGLSGEVRVHQEMDASLMDRLPGPYDIILQDASSASYPALLDALTGRLRPGGLMLADDVLFAVTAGRPGPRARLQEYNQEISGRPDLFSTILALGDGLAVSLKLPEDKSYD